MLKLHNELDKIYLAKARDAGQEHIFDGWDDLRPEVQVRLLSQVESLDFQLLRRLIQRHILSSAGKVEPRVLRPAPLTPRPSPEADREGYELSRTLGEYSFRAGEVLFVTAAGSIGPGPFGEPVGFLPVGPVTAKSLFQLHAEKILATNRRFRSNSHWVICCHPAAMDAVGDYFKSKSWFGLKSSMVHLVPQSLLPVVDRRGKILLESPGQLAMSPSGHGSILLHLLDQLDAFENWGVKHVLYFQVNNPLVSLADTVFLGLHIKEHAEVSSKAVEKTAPEEEVGVFCQSNDSIEVVEYTELGPEERTRYKSDGRLAFSAANVGLHVFSLEFLRRMREEGLQLPFHATPRTTQCWRRGKPFRPVEPNSLEFKVFVFDALSVARRILVCEVDRSEEFSPIRNPGGPNSPQTAQQDLSRLHARWLREAWGWNPEESTPVVEIPPHFALDLEELRSKPPQALPRTGSILVGGAS